MARMLFDDDVTLLRPKEIDHLVASVVEPIWDGTVPRPVVGNEGLQWIAAPSSVEHETAVAVPEDDLFLPAELDLSGARRIRHGHQDVTRRQLYPDCTTRPRSAVFRYVLSRRC